VEAKYHNVSYPTDPSGGGGNWPSGPFDPELTPVNRNSADVLIPAFLAAYTGKSASSTPLDLFPALKNILPNWTVSYEGLMQIPVFKKNFRSFVLDHAYKCTYSIGSYTSFNNWTESGDGTGFITNQITDILEPSSAYNIAAVTLTEGFDPLFKITSTFLNNMSLNINYRIMRTVGLNISSYQINERNETAWTIGAGYRFENFNRVLKMRKTGGANFNNELRLQADVSFSKNQNLIRKIEDGVTQATQGDTQMKISFTADYALSKMITFQAYFDRQMSNPLVSSTAYPFTKTNLGISIRINFAR
jgi:hypothetical protein